VQRALTAANFSAQEQYALWRVLAAVLHLGTLQLDDTRFDENNRTCDIANPESLKSVVKMLQLPNSEALV
jgi:myosin heavy subunit